MTGIMKIPLLTLLYTYTFLQFRLSLQADGDVRRMVRMDNFLVNGRNPLELEKCPENSEYLFLQAFSLCKKSLATLNQDTKLWVIPDHVKADGDDAKTPEERYKDSANFLVRAYYKYCKQFFDEKKNCVLNINKVEAGGDRFRTETGLECEGTGNSYFNGATFCVEKDGSPVEEGESVTLVGFKGMDLEPRCPEDRTISTLSAFEYSSPLVNKGLVNSFYEEAKEKCDGRDRCTIEVTDDGKFKRFRLMTYKCVS